MSIVIINNYRAKNWYFCTTKADLPTFWLVCLLEYHCINIQKVYIFQGAFSTPLSSSPVVILIMHLLFQKVKSKIFNFFLTHCCTCVMLSITDKRRSV